MARRDRDRKKKKDKKSSKSKRSSRSELRKQREQRKVKGDDLKRRVKTGRERARRQKTVVSDPNVEMWIPKDGTHIIDLIPYLVGKHDSVSEEGKETYTFEYYVHRNVGPSDALYICLAETYGKPCPICEHRQRLRDKGADDEVWKKLFPKRRNLYNVVCYDRGADDEKVLVWDISWFYFEKHLLAASQKATRGGGTEEIEFADIEDGRTIQFTIEPAKSKDDYATFLGHSFEERNYEISDDLLNEAHTLDEIVHRPTYEEMADAFHGEKGQRDSKSKSDDDDEESDDMLEGLIDDVKDLDDIEDLKEFIDDEQLEIKIKRRDDEDDVKDKIIKALEDKYPEHEDKDDSDGDYTEDEIREMSKKELRSLIKEEDLDINPKDFDDLEDLQDEVIDELELDLD